MDKTFNHSVKESEIYSYWENHKLFSPEGVDSLRAKFNIKGNKNSYSVLMPPPNANAALHCGHATYSIQDLMIRFKRMQGFDALYLPGTDHAGFETQVVYERKLKKEGKSRFDFDRKTLFDNILNFVHENSDLAISQLKRLGMSADWDRNTFMLDQKVVDFVYQTFIKMFNDGMVYRDGYMVNYSTFHGTTFSDLETEYKDSISPLYYVKYALENNSEEYITVATVRPETIYADVAIAINPKDKRYAKYKGQKVVNPLNGRVMPIIEDEYVDIEFGTGALKITPGHDINDYKIGKAHNLEVISLINLDGLMNENASECQGMYPNQARLKAAELLMAKNALDKVDEKYENRVLVDYKDGLPIEPMVLPNWFLDMNKLGDLAINSIQSGEVKFNLPSWKRDVLRWISDKKPWPISRQTVFGIRIPVWYEIDETDSLHVSFIDKEGNNKQGRVSDLLETYTLDEIKSGLQKVLANVNAKYVVSIESPGENYLPETDTFDTWFSSGQWPLSTTGYPESEIYKKYFPTDFLDSMWDIMFFWIARMIMISKYITGKAPFKMVYFHGAITDKHGVKMSKSKGNVINPMEYVEKYGADALRMGIIVGGNTEAKTSPLDEDKVRGYRNFANKIWNIARFLEMKEQDSLIESESPQEEDEKILNDLNELKVYVTKNIEKMKYKQAGEELYQFIWERLANDYLEKNKSRTDSQFTQTLRYVFETGIKLLHPYMPFITEAVWQEINPQKEPLIISEWPK